VHGSVLQNKKYIKFASENTVEVMALSRLQEGIQKKDRKAATYKAKDGTVYLVQFPNLTVADIGKLRSSKAGSYNNTGKIPYTAIVDPHTLEEMESIKGGYSGKTLMEIVKIHRKALEADHGRSISRKVLTKIRKQQTGIEKELEKESYSKALAATAKLEKSVAKQPAALIEMAGKIKAGVVAACAKKLDSLEALIGRGAKGEASKELGPLARALKGTSLEERAGELLARAKAE
jgi:hypothetical protein